MTTDQVIATRQRVLLARAVEELRALAAEANKLADGLEGRGLEALALGGGLGAKPARAAETLAQLQALWDVLTHPMRGE